MGEQVNRSMAGFVPIKTMGRKPWGSRRARVAVEYSVETCQALKDAFESAQVARPMRVRRYDAGDVLNYELAGVAPLRRARARLRVQRFVGGGFAGQVYRAELLDLEGEPIAGLEAGGNYAVKILVPASPAKRAFRDALFRAGFQGAFSPQVSPAAARAGALWQKLIRRGARIRLGTERAVVDVLATFFDSRLGSCGEISEWIDGRNWLFEADDRLDERKRWLRGRAVDEASLGSPEYRAKRVFMADLVELMHEMGAHELARQYEWWTAKSQPNVLKRLACPPDPAGGLTAVDFRAGLALLPLLPMSPADVKLIFQGLARGSLVQFDRGNLKELERFVEAHAEHFGDLRGGLAELHQAERAYRDSLPDLTHHHVRLLYSGHLWSAIRAGLVESWHARHLADDRTADRLRRSPLATMLFAILGTLPLLGVPGGAAILIAALAAGSLGGAWAGLAAAVGVAVPILAVLLRRLCGRADYRNHLWRQLTSWDYFLRARRARAAERLTDWHRAGAVSSGRAMRLLNSPLRYVAHAAFFAWLPGRLHRLLSDRRYAWSRVKLAATRLVRLYFDPAAREQWLREMVAEGREQGMLTAQEADRIHTRIKDPFIQKYLKSLVVHLCTLPLTQIVSVSVALAYVLTHPELSWHQAGLQAGLILGAFQFTPISPGSLARGLYVVYLVARERNFRDYNIAVFLGFFKYVGYLAFPVQMAYHYPALARFMAGRWATGAVHFLPVFGERGALLEHGVFDACYNHLLTWRRRIREKDLRRRGRRPRRWHLAACALGGMGLLAGIDLAHVARAGAAPTLLHLWYLTLPVPLLAGAAAGAFAGGMTATRRMLAAARVGVVLAIAYGISNVTLAVFVLPGPEAPSGVLQIVWEYSAAILWRLLLFTVLAVLGAFLAEEKIPIRSHPAGADERPLPPQPRPEEELDRQIGV